MHYPIKLKNLKSAVFPAVRSRLLTLLKTVYSPLSEYTIVIGSDQFHPVDVTKNQLEVFLFMWGEKDGRISASI